MQVHKLIGLHVAALDNVILSSKHFLSKQTDSADVSYSHVCSFAKMHTEILNGCLHVNISKKFFFLNYGTEQGRDRYKCHKGLNAISHCDLIISWAQ